MARVPNTNTFRLSEVVAVIDDDLKSGAITSVTNNGAGDARLHTASTVGLVLGRNVTITGTIDYNGTFSVVVLTATYFEIEAFYVNSQIGVWQYAGLINRLTECFTHANADLFDSSYEGVKDRMSNFRNYGWNFIFTVISTHYDDGDLVRPRSYNNLDGSTGWLFVACADGLVSYAVSSSVLSYKDTWWDPGNDSLVNIWVADSKNFIFCVERSDFDYKALRSFTYNVVTGVLTSIDDDGPGTGLPLWGNTSGHGNTITGDDNKFVFYLTQPSDGYNSIITSEYDGSANLTYRRSWPGAYTETFNAIWYDIASGYLFTVGSAGISIFSVNQTTGLLTRIDSEDGSLSYGWNDIWTDGTYAYVSTTLYGLAVFSWDGSGNLTLEDWTDADDSSPLLAISGDIDNKFIYCRGSDSRVHIFTFHDGEVYCHGESTAAISDMVDIHVPFDVANVLAVARQTTGLSIYGDT